MTIFLGLCQALFPNYLLAKAVLEDVFLIRLDTLPGLVIDAIGVQEHVPARFRGCSYSVNDTSRQGYLF